MILQPRLFLAPNGDTYTDGLREYDRVTTVIHTLIPRAGFDMIPEEVVEKARIRGVRTERLIELYLLSGEAEIEPGEVKEVSDNLEAFARWHEAAGFPELLQSQSVVHSNRFGTAGTLDLLFLTMEGRSVVADIKCGYALDAIRWPLQMAAYASSDELTGTIDNLWMIHINKRHRNGIAVVEYDVETWVNEWEKVADVWKLRKEAK